MRSLKTKRFIESLDPSAQALITDHSEFHFRLGPRFTFRPPKTIILGPPCTHYSLLLAHELGHALLHHQSYHTHIELLKLERAAWERARLLCQTYHIPFQETIVEEHLDSYRDFLHTKSICPNCHTTGFQTQDGHYHCPICYHLY